MGLKLTWRDPVWYVTGTVVDPTGEKIRVRKSTGLGKTERARAADAMKRITFEIASGAWSKKSTDEAETLADVIKLFVNRPKPPGATDQGILKRLMRDLGAKKIATLRGLDLMAWVTARDNAPGTVRREIACIEACLAYAKGLGVDMQEIKLPKPSVDDQRNRWLTAADRDRLIEACDEAIRNHVCFLFWTGARLGESFALTWADVVLDGERPHVVLRTRKTRGGKEKKRSVPLRKPVIDALMAQKAARGRRTQDKDLVFVNGDGARWERTPYYKHFNRATKAAKISDFKPHDCRHTFATLLIMAGVRERVVATLLGHSTLALLMRYTHVSPDHMDDVMSVLDAA